MKKEKSKVVVVTGACGYIGGALVKELYRAGYYVIGVDIIRRNHLINYMDVFYLGDFETVLNNAFFSNNGIDVVIHCGAISTVGDSMINPDKYYETNVSKTISLLNNIVRNRDKNLPRFQFCSSASVYESSSLSRNENSPLNPVSPYAKSKKIIEDIILDYHKVYGLPYNIFRYFNVCGAGFGHGQQPFETHIFSKLYESYMNHTEFVLNGNTFDTTDGTCIRDYIHIKDLCDLHLLSLKNPVDGIFNVGDGTGHSNLSIVNKFQEMYELKLNLVIMNKRKGDVDCLVSNSDLAKTVFKWKPYTSTIESIIYSLNEWYESETFKRYKKEKEELGIYLMTK